jgi:hypothetical protein
MTRARAFLLLPLLAIAACQTQRKPLTGYDMPPPGILLGMNGEGSTVLVWPIFDVPIGSQQIFRPRLNGQDAVVVTSDEGFYDYAKLYLSGWTAAWSQWINGIPAGTYVVELVDSSGQSWGASPPLPVSGANGVLNGSTQLPAVVLANFDGHVGSWSVDPTMQDADPATDEIIVTNLLAENVAVERCLIVADRPTSCTHVGTVGPGADFSTVETLAGLVTADHQALFIQLASDASQSYQRNLNKPTNDRASSCQMERIIVHGSHPLTQSPTTGLTSPAMSSCYGYGNGEP